MLWLNFECFSILCDAILLKNVISSHTREMVIYLNCNTLSRSLYNLFLSGFDLTTRDSYFTILVEVFTNHILEKNIIS